MTIGLATRLREASQGPAYRWWVLAAVECGNFVVYMDGFIVTLALPAMARQFGVGIHEIKWVLVAYLAALTVALLLAGRLADRWGRKPMTVVGVALLTLGAALCALAPTLPVLIAFRVLQGLGGALVLANVPLYAQVVLGLSPFFAGLLIVPLSVALTVSSQLVGHLAGRFSARIVSTTGLICTSTGVLGMSLLGPTASYPYMVGLLILAGVGGGLFHPPNNSSVLSAVPPEDLGGANGFFTTARNFGQAIGAALAAAILGQGLGPSGAAEVLAWAPDAVAGGPTLDAYVQAQAFAFRVGATLGLVGAVISALRGSEIPSAPPPGAEGKAAKAPQQRVT